MMDRQIERFYLFYAWNDGDAWRNTSTMGDPKITGIIFFKWFIRFYTITTLVSFEVLSF
jgi:hypothetical protein